MNKRVIVALALALVTTSCTRNSPSPLLNENEILARMLIGDFASGDISKLAGMFYPDAVYDDYSTQSEYQGLREISGYVRSIQSWASSISMDIIAVHVSETGATVEWTLNAIQARPIPGRISVATGADLQVNGVTILQIRKHLIIRAANYMDDLGMMLQLGGVMTMPGGTVIRSNVSRSSGGRPGGG